MDKIQYISFNSEDKPLIKGIISDKEYVLFCDGVIKTVSILGGYTRVCMRPSDDGRVLAAEQGAESFIKAILSSGMTPSRTYQIMSLIAPEYFTDGVVEAVLKCKQMFAYSPLRDWRGLLKTKQDQLAKMEEREEAKRNETLQLIQKLKCEA